MSASRVPARETYDAVLDLGPYESGPPTAYVLVKQTFEIAGGECKLTAPRALFHDLRDETLLPRVVAGTDFWPAKEAADFIVRGSAFAPGGKPVARMIASASIGAASKRIAVFGRREIRWDRDGQPRIEDPEPFTEVPIVYESAYGGVDERVRPPGEVTLPQFVMAVMRTDHPGMYPRNPVGKGYVVAPEPLPGLQMPSLEDPDDLLTPARVITRDPAVWYRQPRPACFDWVPILTFPRYVFFDRSVDAWFPAPDDDRLPEVRRGILPAGFRAARAGGVQPRFFQDAAPELVVPDLAGGEQVRIEGMHPDRAVVEFDLPGPPPSIEFEIEGRREAARPRIRSVLVEPAAGTLDIVYGTSVTLHRTFLPGVHKHIPIAVSIGGDRPIAYDAPATLRDRLAAARGEARG